jgi:hypothetical protein
MVAIAIAAMTLGIRILQIAVALVQSKRMPR